MLTGCELIDRYDDLYKLEAAKWGLDWQCVKALACTESSQDETQSAYRRGNREMYLRLIDGKDRWKAHRYYGRPEILCRAYGLLQVTYVVAMECGFPREGDWWALYGPAVNVACGCAHLGRALARFKNLSSALAYYNAGRVNVTDGKFENQPYVDGIMQSFGRFQEAGNPTGLGHGGGAGA